MHNHRGYFMQRYPVLHRAGQLIASPTGKGEIQTEIAIGEGGDERPNALPCGDHLNQIATLALDRWLHHQTTVSLQAEHHIGQQALADAEADQEPYPGSGKSSFSKGQLHLNLSFK